MTLISSISGIRGTIGGFPGNNLTPEDILNFSKAYSQFIIEDTKKSSPTIVIGMDARPSGSMVEAIIKGTLSAMGINCTLIGMSTTPTIEMAIVDLKADGGIIITASHNPEQWNALKLLNNKGEFLSKAEGEIFDNFLNYNTNVKYVEFDKLGKIKNTSNQIEEHIKKIIELPLVDVKSISDSNFTVVVDAINSTGAISIEPLLKQLGIKTIYVLNSEMTGLFSHNPEPIASNLKQLSEAVIEKKANMGIAVDPDVDRLAFVMENGELFGEEYTLVSVADYVLQNTPGNTVSNLSSTQALKIITEEYGYKYSSSAVGEVNVVEKMKKTNAVIGGEGNGGVIYPKLHYGRDALVGIALFLSFIAKTKQSMTQLRNKYPNFHIAKNKILTEGKKISFEYVKKSIINFYAECTFDETDGLKINFPDNKWVHLRISNTEPIIRIYAESSDEILANELANDVIKKIQEIIQ